MKRKKLWKIVLLALITVLFYCYNPSDYNLFPKCPFLLLTGVQCPGCGSQRAIHCLLHLDIIQAFHYNPLLVSSIPIITILLLAEYYRCNKPLFYIRIHNKKYTWGYFALIILWWIDRNIFNN